METPALQHARIKLPQGKPQREIVPVFRLMASESLRILHISKSSVFMIFRKCVVSPTTECVKWYWVNVPQNRRKSMLCYCQPGQHNNNLAKFSLKNDQPLYKSHLVHPYHAKDKN